MTVIRARESRVPVAEDGPLPPDDAVALVHTPSIEQVYRVQRPRLLRFLSRHTSGQDADDIVQQSFERVLSRQSDLSTRILRPDSYLFRVARNLRIDRAKAVARQMSSDLALDEIEMTVPEQLATPDQIAGLEARDMLNRLEAVMQRMNPRTREIFLAHRIDGYSYKEIANRTGLSVKGVEKHMTRAIATIDRNMRHR